MLGILLQTGVENRIIDTALAASPYNTIAYGLLVLVLLIIIYVLNKEKSDIQKEKTELYKKAAEDLTTINNKYEGLLEKMLIGTQMLASTIDKANGAAEVLSSIRILVKDMDTEVDRLEKITDKQDRKT